MRYRSVLNLHAGPVCTFKTCTLRNFMGAGLTLYGIRYAVYEVVPAYGIPYTAYRIPYTVRGIRGGISVCIEVVDL